MSDESLAGVVYRAVFDAVRAELEENVDLDGAIRDVARSIIEDRAETIAKVQFRRSES